ncbi:hypothetical protein [Paraburkholderia saeva]|jgi:hypothetical protein|uniref:Lipoprotein n=1 Tax=Paraburkholderia saeva TaxID=2777537 RepID=A0A9N8RWI8_9BURK|nr:hypothetical protein [Paraburkholderia saeva]CAG4888278.1 hypothetical protein R52603_00622 [Paraburkholderia saeva]CAG4895519.1 hypothetical protein LMG31841_02166 [Paraburkholderia saeva]CAG4897247.1 hypothetical protein R70241_02299 [Paraburkholderia saeva]
MKYPLIALVAALSACASQPPSDVHPVGQSQNSPKTVAQCIAVKWANSSGQTVYSQYIYANETAFDVFVPGTPAPGGSAAIVRPSPTGTGSSVGFRGADSNASSSISQCL